MPTSKVDTVKFNREWNSPQGHTVFYFDISFEDGTEGQFSTNKKDQNKFFPGDEVEYTIEVKNGAKGDWNKIDKPKEDKGGGSAIPKKKWQKDPKVRKLIMAQTSLKVAVECVRELKTVKEGKELALKDMVHTPEDVLNLAAYFNKWMHDNSGGNEQMEIILQGMLHNAVHLEPAKALNITSSKTVTDIAAILKEGILKIAKVGETNEL